MCLLLVSPKISVHMICVSRWLHLELLISYTSYWGQIVNLSLRPSKQTRIGAVEGRGLPHIYISV